MKKFIPRLKKILFIFLALVFNLLKFSLVLAVFSFEINNASPTSVTSKSQEVGVVLDIVDLPSESYFRVAWQKETGDPYFGYIKNNNGDWVKIEALTGDCSNYYNVTQTGSSQITLITKIGEDTDLTSGDYLLRAHRFTLGCSHTASTNTASINVTLTSPTATPTPEPTNTPTPTNTPSPTKATYQINDVKNEDGDILAHVEIYVDDVYIHHWPPETIEFCEGCRCGDYVDCGLGEHTIKLTKSGYQDWTDTRTFNVGDADEVNPVMLASSEPAPTPTPTPTVTPTIGGTPTPTKKPTVTPTPTGEILGATESGEATASVLSKESLEEEKPETKARSPFFWPKILVGAGLVLMGGAAYPFWLPKLKGLRYNKGHHGKSQKAD